jgi:hypothetical protein
MNTQHKDLNMKHAVFTIPTKVLFAVIFASVTAFACQSTKKSDGGLAKASHTSARHVTAVVRASNRSNIVDGGSVDQVEVIKGQTRSLKIFSRSGGDPAMNGSYVNLAVFIDASEGWKVFELGNVRDYKVLPSAREGFLKLQMTTDTFDVNQNNVKVDSTVFLNLENCERGTISAEEIARNAATGTTRKIAATTDEQIINGAFVDSIAEIKSSSQTSKIFTVSGGDPAMNGAYVNFAVFVDPSEGWKVFELANVRNFQVLDSAREGYLKLSIVRDSIDNEGRQISKKSVLFVNATNADQGTVETEDQR